MENYDSVTHNPKLYLKPPCGCKSDNVVEILVFMEDGKEPFLISGDRVTVV